MDEVKQWEPIMKGGIQPGTTATSDESARLDNQVKVASNTAFEYYSKIYDLKFQAKLTKKQIPYGIGALSPDGGIWFYQDKPIMMIEAKHQGALGNAIERWYKNMYIARVINPNITYLTFATGLGVKQGGPIYDTLYIPHDGEYNVIRAGKNTAFLSVEAFELDKLVFWIKRAFVATMKGITND